MKCISCGGPLKTNRENHNYKESGLGRVTLVGIAVSVCGSCGEREVAIPAIEELHKLIAHAIVMKPARLVAEEVRFLRKFLGFNQPELAGNLGVAVETVNRWENDKSPIPVTADRLLRFLAATRQPIARYESELGKVAVSPPEGTRLRLREKNGIWRTAA